MDDIIVSTDKGQVRGARMSNCVRFLGVPYAAAPGGELRFAEPQPHDAWDDIFDATQPGPNAPQRTRDFPGLDVTTLVGDGWQQGDDYLNANVWTPDPAAKGLPVMVFVHGGGFIVGSNNVSTNDGSSFARDGIVCFSINYRMGIDGFLPIPGVPTNLGLRDQIAALKWVQANAAAFGGDPANVTVFGESAGAMSIADLVTSPLAKGLFRRAIIQSGHGGMTRDIGVAQRLVKKLAKFLKVTPDAAGFRSLSEGDSLDAVEKVGQPTTRLDLRDAEGRECVYGISRFIPVHGDDVLPEKPLKALAKDAGADIDILIGSNSAEMNLYLVPTGVRDKIGRWLATYVLHRSLPKAGKLLKAYGMGQKDKKAGFVLAEAMTDLVFRWSARRFAEEHRGRSHVYEFEWHSPAYDGQLGACHGVELPFVFDSLSTAVGPMGICGSSAPQDLADRMHALWVGFARDGRLPWGEYSRNKRTVYHMAAGAAVEEPPMPCAPFIP